MKTNKIFKYESYGETLAFAEFLGFQDSCNKEDWNEAIADGLEERAIDFITEQGYKIEGYYL